MKSESPIADTIRTIWSEEGDNVRMAGIHDETLALFAAGKGHEANILALRYLAGFTAIAIEKLQESGIRTIGEAMGLDDDTLLSAEAGIFEAAKLRKLKDLPGYHQPAKI